MSKKNVVMDGNEAAAYTAFKTNEVCAIYPITPSSNMGEWADEWSAKKQKNIWGTTPTVTEMQSEGGASGAVHGALQTGALTTTFTASQGLLLMIPNMYKIAGELTSTVFHVSARTLATHALSIFGDHSDVMSTRSTGWAMIDSNSVQEVMDTALIAQAATLNARVPFLHFFDGFRTSSEVNNVEKIGEDVIRKMIDDDLVIAHRNRGLNPNNPVLRGTAQNPDVFFQARESLSPYYTKVPAIVQEQMDKFAELTGRQYRLFDYFGAEDAERIIIVMGSGAETVEETLNPLLESGEKVGVVKVRLYRPFSKEHLLAALPKTSKKIAVLDRTKEPGALGEPLYQDVLSALTELYSDGKLDMDLPKIVGGRFGLSSKEFTPGMVKGIFDELKKDEPKRSFTIGINDDVSNSSLEYDAHFLPPQEEINRAMFFGMGSDGTVGANKNSVKIIGLETENNAQGYFVYDSKKSGSYTISHLRFSKNQIKSPYLIDKANFVACHKFEIMETLDVMRHVEKGGTFLLNAAGSTEDVWKRLPKKVQETIVANNINFYVIDGLKVAEAAGMGNRINTVMQACFFAISEVLPRDEAIEKIKAATHKTFIRKGQDVVDKNFRAIDASLDNLVKVDYSKFSINGRELGQLIPDEAPDFVKNVLARIIEGKGDSLSVSAFEADGTFPTDTTKWEKRNIATQVPVWDPEICTQCNKCVLVCPHATIRPKIYDDALLANAPETFKSTKAKGKKWGVDNPVYTLQVAVEDCTGCEICVKACPVTDKETGKHAINMEEQLPLRETERKNWDYFLDIPEMNRSLLRIDQKSSQFMQPLFEFSGACSGCGETPYIKLATQLFGDRMIIANATGCSSIYGGNLPTTPYSKNKDGRGPSWNNSLFEDNAEFGLGYRLSIDKHAEHAAELVVALKSEIGEDLANGILNANQSSEKGIFEQRERIEKMNAILKGLNKREAKSLLSISDNLAKKSVWIIGGDGWAYDIGFGGLDHVLASGKNVNILVLDTEVYSNTGGQSSKATPMGAVAKFAAGGKPSLKKDLGQIAMSYGNVYVASVAMGADDRQTVRAFAEAEAYDGPSIIIAYSHCIAWGIEMEDGMDLQDLAVKSGHWLLYRYNPDLYPKKNPLKVESRKPSESIAKYYDSERRFHMLKGIDEDAAKLYVKESERFARDRFEHYKNLEAKKIEVS